MGTARKEEALAVAQSTADLSNQLTFIRTTLANIGESQEQPHGPFCRYVQLHRPPDSNNRLTRRLQLYRHRPELITACGQDTRPCAFAKNDGDKISHDSPMFADACLSSCLAQQGICSRECSILQDVLAKVLISDPHLADAMALKAYAFLLQRLLQVSGTCCDDRHLQSFIKCIHSELSCIHNLSLSGFSSTRSRAPGSRSERVILTIWHKSQRAVLQRLLSQSQDGLLKRGQAERQQHTSLP